MVVLGTLLDFQLMPEVRWSLVRAVLSNYTQGAGSNSHKNEWEFVRQRIKVPQTHF